MAEPQHAGVMSPATATPPGLRPAADDRQLRLDFRRQARTFALAARLLPRERRIAVAALYAYCRAVDEIADRRPPADDAAADLAAVRTALDETLAGRPPSSGVPTPALWSRLHQVDRRFGLDSQPMEELLDGAAWDIEGRPIRDVADLLRYSDLVAGSVGAMMLPLLVDDARRRESLEAPARTLGRAMQLTNILRDVGEDRDVLRRVYLPMDALERHGIAISDVSPPVPQSYRDLCEEVMELAERFYEEARPAIRRLPGPARAAVRSAARMYREILNEVRRNDYDNLTHRAVVPPHRKAVAALGGYARRRARLRGG